MSYKPAAIANYFLDLAENGGKKLTPMKVQKLVFFAHGWNLALNGESLIDEQVEAWKFGPVVRSLYHDLKSFGSDDITGRISKMKHDPSLPAMGTGLLAKFNQWRSYTPAVPETDAETRLFLDQVWDVYADFTGIQLSNMTHSPDSPWSTVMKLCNNAPPKGTDIPAQIITEYFTKIANEQ